MKTETPSLNELIDRIETVCIKRLENTRFNGRDWNDIVPITLACALLEGAWSTLKLAELGMKMQAYVLARSVVEIDIEFARVCKDNKNILDFRLRSAENWLKTLNRAENGNPFFKSIAESETFEQVREEKQREIRDLKKTGAQNLSIKERFLSVGQKDVYEGLYFKLSDETHGSLNALISRFVDVSKGVPDFSAFHHPGEQGFDALMQLISDILDRFDARIDERFPIPLP